jgi:hypothetical protein
MFDELVRIAKEAVAASCENYSPGKLDKLSQKVGTGYLSKICQGQ